MVDNDPHESMRWLILGDSDEHKEGDNDAWWMIAVDDRLQFYGKTDGPSESGCQSWSMLIPVMVVAPGPRVRHVPLSFANGASCPIFPTLVKRADVPHSW